VAGNSLGEFVTNVCARWSWISTELVEEVSAQLSALTLADPSERWLGALIAERPGSRELHRDSVNGFMLLAHTEREGLYRPPHDHGRAWVVYAVQSGELEIGTFAKVLDEYGRIKLVRRDRTVLRPGQARAYLPGDIHDTRCLSDTALLFRFTERDLRQEEQVEQRLTRFVEDGGEWRPPSA